MGPDGIRTRPGGGCTCDVEFVVAKYDYIIGREVGRAALPRATHGHREQCIAIARFVTKCAAGKIAPEIEMLELEFCALLAITGQQREKDVRTPGQSFQQRAHSRQNILRMSGFGKRLEQALAITGAKTC